MSVEAALIEVARRIDEQKRFTKLFADPHELLGVRDLPNADDHLSEEECDLFGLVDGRRTVAEIVEGAPLSEYESYEALQRMHEAGWIESVGRRDPGTPAPPPTPAAASAGEESGARGGARAMRGPVGEILVGLAVLVVAGGLVFAGRALHHKAAAPGADAYAATELRDIRSALELYRREHGGYPEQLGNLSASSWIAKHQLKVAGKTPQYRLERGGQSYRLELAKR
jgi:hypothetical protein